MIRPAHNRAAGFAGVVATSALLLYFIFPGPRVLEETRGNATTSLDDENEETCDGASFTPLRTPTAVLRQQPSRPLSSSSEKMPDGVSVMGPGNSDSAENGARHPHPITPKHESIFEENAIIGSLNGAMDVADVDAMREMNRKFKSAFSESAPLQEGYDIIADCIEQQSPQRRARAARYYEEKRASPLRRYVRRYCFEH